MFEVIPKQIRYADLAPFGKYLTFKELCGKVRGVVITDLTDGKRWATDWLFRRTLQDLGDLLDFMLGEDGYERLKAARLAVLVEASRYKLMTQDEKEEQRRSFAYGNVALSNSAITRGDIDRAYAEEISNGATPKMDVQLPGAGFERYDREPENEAVTDEITASLLSQPPAIRRRGTLVVKPDTSPAIPPTTSESSFEEWLTTEDEKAYKDLQEDTPTMEEIGKALGYRTGQTKVLYEGDLTKPAPTLTVTKIDQETKTVTLTGALSPELESACAALGEAAGQRWAEEHNRWIEENGIFLEPDKGGLKILIGWKNGPMDFTGRWKTREGGIADVGAQNRDDWNEEGRHRHDTNLDLMERLRDGGNRIFEPTRKDVLTELAAYDQELDI